MNRHLIIVAGGRGTRMGGEVPKQFLLLGGKPVLMRTLETFRAYDASLHVIVVLPDDQKAVWEQLCRACRFTMPHDVAGGGATRFHSVRNGLELVSGEGLVGVHDGVRPFVSREVIARCYAEAERRRAVVPVVDMVETVRRILPDGSRTVPRTEYKLVQTPQVFDIPLLKRAYGQDYADTFTDDASVVEAMGQKVHLVPGNRENIKLTTPFDLRIAEALL